MAGTAMEETWSSFKPATSPALKALIWSAVNKEMSVVAVTLAGTVALRNVTDALLKLLIVLAMVYSFLTLGGLQRQ
jgi:hypothetical protein